MSKRPVEPVEEPESKRSKAYGDSSFKVELNPADCNLDFTIQKDGLTGSALHDNGFAYCWSGARANLGIKGGKYCFGCKVIAIQRVTMEDTQKDQQNISRVGISRGDDDVGSLGESVHSFGYGGTGKFSNSGKFSDYGGRFGLGDTIICAVDLESKPMAKISFSKNGSSLGVAKTFNAGPQGLNILGSPQKKMKWEGALFPHVLLKNVEIQMLFSVSDGLTPMDGYKPWDSALQDGNGVDGPAIGNHADCEVMMTVGLPAAGKTTWAEKWVKEHPEKRYMLLGTNLALDQMKVPGMMRKHNYGERFDRLMDRATKIFNKLMERAANLPRNYIVDQTNVYRSARLRKLKPFRGFRKIAVVVFPDEETLKHRSVNRFREMGKEVPADAVNEMLANFVLPLTKDMPGSIEPFDEVWFPELKREVADKLLQKMKSNLPPNFASKGSKSASKGSRDSTQERQSRENSTSSVHGHYQSPYQVDRRESFGSYTSPYLEVSPSPYGRGLTATGPPIRDGGAYSSSSTGSYYDPRSAPSYQGTPQGFQHNAVRDAFGYRGASPGGFNDRYPTPQPSYLGHPYQSIPPTRPGLPPQMPDPNSGYNRRLF